jgi:hypothetical protein
MYIKNWTLITAIGGKTLLLVTLLTLPATAKHSKTGRHAAELDNRLYTFNEVPSNALREIPRKEERKKSDQKSMIKPVCAEPHHFDP